MSDRGTTERPIRTVEEESYNPQRQKIFDQLRQELGGFWALGWESILKSIQKLNPPEAGKEELRRLVVGYINTTFRYGHFSNLDGIEPVLDYLGITDIEFTPTQSGKILELYGKYSLDFLYSMSPTLYDGKLSTGKPYDQIKYTRKLLQMKGASAEELTDIYIKQLWEYREILVKMHQNFRVKTLLRSGQKLIDFVREISEK